MDSSEPIAVSDQDVVSRAAAGDHAAFEWVMRQHNRRLFRIVRSILKNDADAEEALQEAYITAYRALKHFRGDSQVSTWLTRIAINEALGRLRRQKTERVVIPFSSDNEEATDALRAIRAEESATSPEEDTLRAEMRTLLERKIDELPMAFRTVFIMRELEEMSVEETAQCLDIPAATVRSRLFRAKEGYCGNRSHVKSTSPCLAHFHSPASDAIASWRPSSLV